MNGETKLTPQHIYVDLLQYICAHYMKYNIIEFAANTYFSPMLVTLLSYTTQ